MVDLRDLHQGRRRVRLVRRRPQFDGRPLRRPGMLSRVPEDRIREQHWRIGVERIFWRVLPSALEGRKDVGLPARSKLAERVPPGGGEGPVSDSAQERIGKRKAQGAADSLRHLMEHRLGRLPLAAVGRIADARASELVAWYKAALDDPSLNEVFGVPAGDRLATPREPARHRDPWRWPGSNQPSANPSYAAQRQRACRAPCRA